MNLSEEQPPPSLGKWYVRVHIKVCRFDLSSKSSSTIVGKEKFTSGEHVARITPVMPNSTNGLLRSGMSAKSASCAAAALDDSHNFSTPALREQMLAAFAASRKLALTEVLGFNINPFIANIAFYCWTPSDFIFTISTKPPNRNNQKIRFRREGRSREILSGWPKVNACIVLRGE